MADPAYASDLVMAKFGEVLCRESELQGRFGNFLLRSLAMAALARAMGFEPNSDSGNGRRGLAPWRLARVIKFIEENLADDLSLEEIAQRAGLSRMHFAAQFKTATGQSPHAFLLARRIELAKSLLTEGRIPLVQVAFTAGFSSQAHFTTVFRKAVGVTPGRWRQRLVRHEHDGSMLPLTVDQHGAIDSSTGHAGESAGVRDD
jgi:AraC-like DNA-binding protein